VYINFWYPIARVDEVTTERPLQAEIFGLPLVAFRDGQGAAHVLADTCAHRGGSLGRGRLEGDFIVCPYHGWQYAGDGRCMHVPSLADAKPPARAKVDSYPVEEKYGIVFAFLGDLPEAERPPIYDVEEYAQEGWKSELYTLELNCYYQRSVENGLDPIHNEFVHPMQGAPGMDAEAQSKPLPMTKIPWGNKFWMSFKETRDPNTDVSSQRGESQNSAGSWHQGPNQLVTWIHFQTAKFGEAVFHQYFFEQPVDESHTRIFFLNMRNWMLEDDKDERVRDVTLRVVGEDIGILEKLRPVRTPESNAKEVLLTGDAAVVSYRESLRDWDRRGWRIDSKTLREQQKGTAFAIPCPDRRKSGNWVLDSVPLMSFPG